MIKQRVVLVTGVSSGIGKACAEHLARKGCLVFGTSRREETLGLIRVQEFNGGELYLFPMDVTDDESVRKGVATVLERTGRIDVVINNAGMGVAGPVEEISDNEAWLQMNTNFMGSFRVCRAVLPCMRQKGEGLIIFISSLAAEVGLPFQALYSASKAALNNFAAGLQIECLPIKVVVVEPGDFHTPFTEHRIMARGHSSASSYRERCRIAIHNQEEAERKGGDPKKIASLMWRIIQSPSPRFCYRIGPDAALVGLLGRLLPPRLVQKLVASNYGL